MNENIREIGKKAGLYMENSMPGGFPNEDLMVANDYAKLIVQECIDILEARNNHAVIVNAIQEIREHFGLKK